MAFPFRRGIKKAGIGSITYQQSTLTKSMAVLSQAHNIFVLVSHDKQSSNMPTNQWAIITGASAGIGASLFRRLVQEEPNLNCLGVARRMSQL